MVKRPVSGMRAWLVQRASAVYMLLFIAYLLAHFIVDPPQGYAHWRAWVLSPTISLAASVFFGATLLHAWVGLRDVTLDYVKAAPLRIGVLATLMFALSTAGLWVLRILWVGQS